VEFGGSMKRWCAAIVGLAWAWTLLAGCQKSIFVQEPDLFDAQKRLGLPLQPENDPTAGIEPFLGPVSEPATVTDPDRPPRYMNLREAIAIALENGTTGRQAILPGAPALGAGLATDDMVSFTGNGVVGSDAIRVFALTPASFGSSIDEALARFDTQWLTSLSWSTTDNPNSGFSSFSNGQGANFSTALVQPTVTGGYAGITFSTVYANLVNPPTGAFSVINPAYTTNLSFGFEQPLLRFFGVEINQILPAFPNSLLFQGLNGRPAAGTPEGILITRLRFDQARAEFERRLNFMLLNVEVAYWNLYAAYGALYSADQGLRQSREAWRITNDQKEIGTVAKVVLNQVRAQYEQFRIDRLTAINQVQENERVLRVLLGMKVEDGTRLVPVDPPTLAPYVPNWDAAFQDALSLRPELVMTREDLKTKQLGLLAAKAFLRPDLRLTGNYTLVGLGTSLQGGGTIVGATESFSANSLHTLATGNFVNWNVGLNMTVPLGFRFEMAQVRQARLALAQAYEVLKDQEKKAHNVLARTYRLVIETYKVLEARRLRRIELGEELQFLTDNVEAGRFNATDRTKYGDSLLDAQRLFAQALSDEFQSIVDYNNALVGFEFAKGTIQIHDQVVIGEGPLPEAAQVRAVDHERQRTAALVLNERIAAFGPGAENRTSACQFPDGAPSLPRLWEKGPRLDRGDEPLPEPRRQPSGPGAPDQTPPPASRGGNSGVLPPNSPDNPRLGMPDFSETSR
jgi:outer membrane protein TolC